MTLAEMRAELQRELALRALSGATWDYSATLLQYGRPLVRANLHKGSTFAYYGTTHVIEKIERSEVIVDKPRRIVLTIGHFLACVLNGQARDP